MIKCVHEYRINKKACECFRSRNLEAALDRLQDLQAKHPNTIYTLQRRSCDVNKYGVLSFEAATGKTRWSAWDDWRVFR